MKLPPPPPKKKKKKKMIEIFIQENPFENIVWKVVAILSRPQCVKRCYEYVCGDFVVLYIWVPLTSNQRFSFGGRTNCINILRKAICYLYYSTAHLMPQIFLVIWTWRTSLFSTNMGSRYNQSYLMTTESSPFPLRWLRQNTVTIFKKSVWYHWRHNEI